MEERTDRLTITVLCANEERRLVSARRRSKFLASVVVPTYWGGSDWGRIASGIRPGVALGCAGCVAHGKVLDVSDVGNALKVGGC